MGQDTAGAADPHPEHDPGQGSVAPDEPTPARTATRTAAFFDLDKTIIATSSATAFSRGFLAEGLLTRRNVLRTAVAQFLYLVGGADEVQTERLRANLSRTVAGWPVSQVSQVVAETLHQAIDPTVYAEAVTLIEEHHAAGHDVVIVSASGSEIVEPIAAVLGADHVVATRMQVLEGRYTGGIDFYAYGENKAVAIRDLAERHGYDLEASFAYSDSITDSPMLAAVGHGFAVNPDRALRRVALENGWGTLTFRRPVPLFDFDREARVTTGVVVGLVVVAGVTWWTVRKVRRARAA
jgi:HAD superfamily hydrolase (TIGR01490 family)